MAKKPKAQRRSGPKGRHLHAAHECHSHQEGADHTAQMSRINRIVGQLQGVGRMIEARRYCPDILMQTQAIVSAIRSLESAVLEDHLRHCVKKAFAAPSEADAETTLRELLELYAARD